MIEPLRRRFSGPLAVALAAVVILTAAPAGAQTPLPEPTVVDPALRVRTVVQGLDSPVSLAFLGPGDLLVTERTGRVKRVVEGTVVATVLDLPINSASDRGLLGLALHPRFADNGFVYLFWTESATGADTTDITQVPLLGNRLDRYRWDGAALSFDRTLIRLRSYQADEGQLARGSHNGGVLRFGPDGRLYVYMGDNGRRGQLQNLADGPFGPGIPDDQFGGPEPDAAHLTGVILRLADDGAAPPDNPFFEEGAQRGGEVGAALQRIYGYGLRNSIGMAFDPVSGALWEQENGDDAFSEINRVEAGMNSGWAQFMGPPERIAEFKAIETDRTAPRPDAPRGYFGLQQTRWSPERLASTPEEALSRLFVLPGSAYSAPELSWRYEIAPGGIGFVEGDALGEGYAGDLVVGSARPTLLGGQLFRLELSADRRELAFEDPRLADRVADNAFKYDVTESESLVWGRDFGLVTDVGTGPDGSLHVVSLSRGAVYEIEHAP